MLFVWSEPFLLKFYLAFSFAHFLRVFCPQGDYKVLPGFFPHAAGQIASNGPYEKVSDIYKIKGLTPNDKALFKKYESAFTVNPPGRAFDERINARVST